MQLSDLIGEGVSGAKKLVATCGELAADAVSAATFMASLGVARVAFAVECAVEQASPEVRERVTDACGVLYGLSRRIDGMSETWEKVLEVQIPAQGAGQWHINQRESTHSPYNVHQRKDMLRLAFHSHSSLFSGFRLVVESDVDRIELNVKRLGLVQVTWTIDGRRMICPAARLLSGERHVERNAESGEDVVRLFSLPKAKFRPKTPAE